MYVSPAKAVKMYKVSKPTLYSDMKTGKLSYNLNDRKKRKINVAELERLYQKRSSEEGASNTETVKSKSDLTESNVSNQNLEKALQEARENLAESQKRETELLKEQVQQLQNQVDHLNKNLNKALDITALIEDKREGQGAKEAQMDAKLEILERHLSKLEAQNHRLITKEQERKKKIEELEQIAKEKKKGWIGWLFG